MATNVFRTACPGGRDRDAKTSLSRLWVYLLLVWAFAFTVSPEIHAQSQTYVIDFQAGTNGRGALFAVSETGNRTIISDFGDPSQGPIGREPFAIAWDGTWLIVVDYWAGTDCGGTGLVGCGALFRVNPATGVREIWSDFGDPSQGEIGSRLFSVAVDANGDYIVADQGGVAGTLVRVSAATGNRTVISRFGDVTQGPTGGRPSGIAIAENGAILVADPYPIPLLFSVDPNTGMRTIVSDLTNSGQGPFGEVPIDVELASPSSLWLLDQVKYTAPDGLGQLLRVDAATGTRTVVSDFSNPAQGPIGLNVNNVRLNGAGSVLVMDFDAGTDSRGALFAVNTSDGTRTIVSDFGDPGTGPLGEEPSGVVVFAAAPPPPPPPPGNVTLTVTKSGNGSGYVSSSPVGITCGTDCSENYPLNTVVTLNAAPDAGSFFIGWSGSADCEDGLVAMTQSQPCTATFQRSLIGNGAGIDVRFWHCSGPPDLSNRNPNACGQARSPNKITSYTRSQLECYPDKENSCLSPQVAVVKTGPLAFPPLKYNIYFSLDSQLGAEDALMISRVHDFSKSPDYPLLKWQSGLGPGLYYLFAVLDPDNSLREANENNNIQRWVFRVK